MKIYWKVIIWRRNEERNDEENTIRRNVEREEINEESLISILKNKNVSKRKWKRNDERNKLSMKERRK